MPLKPGDSDRQLNNRKGAPGRGAEDLERVPIQEPVNAPFLNWLFSNGFSRGITAP